MMGEQVEVAPRKRGGTIRQLCSTCRFWDVHNLSAKIGDCKAPGAGNFGVSVASFSGRRRAYFDGGTKETKPGDTCQKWSLGQSPQPKRLAKGKRT
jgi:hypothetical protein